MKKYSLSLAVILCIALIFAAKNKMGQETVWTVGEVAEDIAQSPNITMTAVPGTVTPTRIELHIENRGDEPQFCGAPYQLQVEVKGVWHTMTLKKAAVFPAIAEQVDKGVPLLVVENWENNYGELPAGKYRVIKFFSSGDWLEPEAAACVFELF